MVDFAAHGWLYWVIIILQIICILHVIRTRNDFYWIFLIVFLPMIGCAIYVILHRRTLLPSARMPFSIKIPMIEALNERSIEQDFRQSDTLDNRILFANVLINRGQAQQAIELLTPALSGPQRSHIGLLYTCARAHYANNDIAATLAMLERAEAVPNNEKLKQRNLLMAMCHEAQGNHVQADEKYHAAQGGFVGEEAKARYALFLKATGKTTAANLLFKRIIEETDIAPRQYRHEQKVWYDIARSNLAENNNG